MKVLIVEDDESSRSYLEAAIKGQGHEVVLAFDGQLGLQAFEDCQPDMVLTDIRMPNMDGLQMLEGIREISADVIVVVMTGYGSEAYAVKALELRANNYLRKPLRHQYLVLLLRKYADALKARSLKAEIPGLSDLDSQLLEFDSTMSLVPIVANKLTEAISDVVDEDSLLGIRLGLIELISNAIEHGNLGISYEEKTNAMENGGTNAIDLLIEERQSSAETIGKRVSIEFNHDQNFVEWIIRDEGQGFDWQDERYIASDEESILSMHGRGIYLSRFQFDELEYSGNGNTVRVRKYINKPPEPENQ